MENTNTVYKEIFEKYGVTSTGIDVAIRKAKELVSKEIDIIHDRMIREYKVDSIFKQVYKDRLEYKENHYYEWNKILEQTAKIYVPAKYLNSDPQDNILSIYIDKNRVR